MARPKRFELLTPRFVVWCSIQLSCLVYELVVHLDAEIIPTPGRLWPSEFTNPRRGSDDVDASSAKILRAASPKLPQRKQSKGRFVMPPIGDGYFCARLAGGANPLPLGCYRRSHEIALAEFDAAMAQDVVGGGGVEIEIRQTEI
jgi:hypothetical protein